MVEKGEKQLIDEERETVMTDTKIKQLNQSGDYYFCSLCAAWRRCTNDPSSNGNQHLSHLEENETNSPASKNHSTIFCAYPIRPPASTMLRTKSGSGVAW